MTGSRLSKRTLDQVMGRDRKRVKKKRKQVSSEKKKIEGQPSQGYVSASTNDEVEPRNISNELEPPNIPNNSPEDDRNDGEFDCPQGKQDISKEDGDEGMMSDCEDEKDMDIDENRSIDDEDKVVKVEDMLTRRQAKMDSDRLLSCL